MRRTLHKSKRDLPPPPSLLHASRAPPSVAHDHSSRDDAGLAWSDWPFSRWAKPALGTSPVFHTRQQGGKPVEVSSRGRTACEANGKSGHAMDGEKRQEEGRVRD
jgi:hypothetical protein